MWRCCNQKRIHSVCCEAGLRVNACVCAVETAEFRFYTPQFPVHKDPMLPHFQQHRSHCIHRMDFTAPPLLFNAFLLAKLLYCMVTHTYVQLQLKRSSKSPCEPIISCSDKSVSWGFWQAIQEIISSGKTAIFILSIIKSSSSSTRQLKVENAFMPSKRANCMVGNPIERQWFKNSSDCSSFCVIVTRKTAHLIWIQWWEELAPPPAAPVQH